MSQIPGKIIKIWLNDGKIKKMHLEAACSSTQGHSVRKNALFPTQKYYYEPFFGGHLMEWFSDRLFLDFGIEFLSISSLWIFVDMGLIMGSNLFFSLRKIPFWKNNFENKFQNTNFKISNSRIQKKTKKCIERFLIHSQERLWYRICGMIQPCHCSFPRNTSTWGVRLALRHCESLLVRLSTFLGLVFPSSRFKRSFSVWFVFSFKNSFFFEANYRFDKHFGFHVCLAKTFSINLCWRTQVFQKVSCPRGDHNPSTSAF